MPCTAQVCQVPYRAPRELDLDWRSRFQPQPVLFSTFFECSISKWQRRFRTDVGKVGVVEDCVNGREARDRTLKKAEDLEEAMGTLETQLQSLEK